MTIEEIKRLLIDARKNMMDDSMLDYAGEQLDVAIAKLDGAADDAAYIGFEVGYEERRQEEF